MATASENGHRCGCTPQISSQKREMALKKKAISLALALEKCPLFSRWTLDTAHCLLPGQKNPKNDFSLGFWLYVMYYCSFFSTNTAQW
jgi:hypothetical protein